MPVVHSKFELVRSRLMWTVVLKTCQEKGVGPCEVCEGHGAICDPRPYAYIRRVCSACRGLGFDLSLLPDGGAAYGYWGFKDVEQDFDLGCFYGDAEEFYEKNYDPAKRFVDRGDPEWDRMWIWLGAETGASATEDGHLEVQDTWQYMGTEQRGSQWFHCFRHRAHWKSPDRELKTVLAKGPFVAG